MLSDGKTSSEPASGVNVSIPANLNTYLNSIMKKVMKLDFVSPFLYPVDTTQFPTYYELISNPMDLTTLKDKITSFDSMEAFIEDASLIWENCRTFNSLESPIVALADKLRKTFMELIQVA